MPDSPTDPRAVDRLDVPRSVPNRADRRARSTAERRYPTPDDLGALGVLARARVRQVGQSRLVSVALREFRARQANGGDAE